MGLIIDIWNSISPAVSILTTLAAIYYARQSYLINTPTLKLSIDNLPPYENDVDLTEIKVVNVGNNTARNIRMIVHCSWFDSMEIYLKFPSKNWVLCPKEEYKWKVRLPCIGSINSGKVTLEAKNEKQSWELSEIIV
ncbi:hypothetical protein VU07_04430 [Desulfobulbus sp. F4]|nr:hypothetical protein [Desulfobulbus sp. F4]